MKRQLLLAALACGLLGSVLRAEDSVPNRPMAIDKGGSAQPSLNNVCNQPLAIDQAAAPTREPWADVFSGVVRSHSQSAPLAVQPFSVQREAFAHSRTLPAPSNIASYRFNGDTVYLVPLVTTAKH